MTTAAPRRAHARAPTRSFSLRELAPAVDTDRPHVRLGLLWAVVTGVAAVAGPGWLAGWLALAAATAAAQVARSWRSAPVRPYPPIAVGAAALVALSAALGPLTVAAAVVVAVAAAFGREPALAVFGRYRPGSHTSAARTLAAGLPIGAATAAVVLARRQGLPEALTLLALAAVYDAGAYVVGAGAAGAWEGPAAGVAAVGAVTLAVAAVLVPPFRGASPWALGAAAAALAPLGPCAATLLLGDRRVRAPALRRLDSLLLLGPVWAALAALLVR